MRNLATISFLLTLAVTGTVPRCAFADDPYSFLVFECVPKAGLFSFRTDGNGNIWEFPANKGSEPKFEPVEALDGLAVMDLMLLGHSHIRKIHCDISPGHEITFELTEYKDGGPGCGAAQPGGSYSIKFDGIVVGELDDLTACMAARSYFVNVSVQTLKIGVFVSSTSCVLTAAFDPGARELKTDALCGTKGLELP